MIKEEAIETALAYLRSSADEAASARANVRYLAEFLKSKKAQLASNFSGSVASAEMRALADPAYLEILDGYRVAVEEDAFHQFKREAAVATIDAWRTQQSNARAEGRVG